MGLKMSDKEEKSEVALSHLREWNTGREMVSLAPLGLSWGNQWLVCSWCCVPCWEGSGRGSQGLSPAPQGPALTSHVQFSPAACVQDAGYQSSCPGPRPLLPSLNQGPVTSTCLPASKATCSRGLSIFSPWVPSPTCSLADVDLRQAKGPLCTPGPHPQLRNNHAPLPRPSPLPPAVTAACQELTKQRQLRSSREAGKESEIIIMAFI